MGEFWGILCFFTSLRVALWGLRKVFVGTPTQLDSTRADPFFLPFFQSGGLLVNLFNMFSISWKFQTPPEFKPYGWLTQDFWMYVPISLSTRRSPFLSSFPFLSHLSTQLNSTQLNSHPKFPYPTIQPASLHHPLPLPPLPSTSLLLPFDAFLPLHPSSFLLLLLLPSKRQPTSTFVLIPTTNETHLPPRRGGLVEGGRESVGGRVDLGVVYDEDGLEL